VPSLRLTPSVHVHQTLRGGNYGLLNRTSGEPNPDFYMAQMFRNQMGAKVLSLATSPAIKKQGLRTYAHCHDSSKVKKRSVAYKDHPPERVCGFLK